MNITSDSIAQSFTATGVQTHSKLADAAQQFEAMLLQEMLKPMRSEDGGWTGEDNKDGASNTITSFGTEAVARAISKSGGLGIAKQVIRQVTAEREKVQKGTDRY
jgi:Rod binding domain-containing protein